MKTLNSLIDRLFKPTQVDVQEAPRFEDWFHQMYPKDNYIPELEEFGKTILEFKNEQKRKLTQQYSRSQSFS